MYLTAAQLADGPIALAALSEIYGVEPALLAVVIDAGDTSAWPPADVARAVNALDSIERFIALAVGEVDARLAHRGYPLPQDATRFPVLTTWSRSIARYHVHQQRDKTDEQRGRIERDYRDAIRALDMVADGKLSLGAGDPLAPDPNAVSGVSVQGNARLFSRGSLGRL